MNQKGSVGLAIIFILLAALVIIGGIWYYNYRTSKHKPIEFVSYDVGTKITSAEMTLKEDFWYLSDVVIPPESEITVSCLNPCEYKVGEEYTRIPQVENNRFTDRLLVSANKSLQEQNIVYITAYQTFTLRTIPIRSAYNNQVSVIVKPINQEEVNNIQAIKDSEYTRWVIEVTVMTIILITVIVGGFWLYSRS